LEFRPTIWRSVLVKRMNHWLSSDSRHHIRIPEHTREIPSIWTRDEPSGHEWNLHSTVIIAEKPRKAEREREMWAHFQSSVVFDHPRERRGSSCSTPGKSLSCYQLRSITFCTWFSSVQNRVFSKQTNYQKPIPDYDVPYRSIMYLLYPCVNKIQFKTSVHISILFWPHWMLGCTHSSTTGLVNEGLRFCIS